MLLQQEYTLKKKNLSTFSIRHNVEVCERLWVRRRRRTRQILVYVLSFYEKSYKRQNFSIINDNQRHTAGRSFFAGGSPRQFSNIGQQMLL